MTSTLLDRMWGYVSRISVATWITVLGLLFYSAKARDYELFYSRLSVDLNDVGLNYATVLTRSSQQIVTPLVLAAISLYTARRSYQSNAIAEWKAGRVHAGRWLRVRQGRAWLTAAGWLLLGGISTIAFGVYGGAMYRADSTIKASAAAVIRGETINGVRLPTKRIEHPTGLSVLNVQVRHAWIEPMAATNVPAGLKSLTGRPLLYLGQADGTLVLFDPTGIQAVYVPRDSVVLNVEAEP